MQEEIFFSVITPTYNRCDKLHRVYDSLSQQCFKSFEWIVIDDGSHDSTADLIQHYQANSDFDIHYFYKENGGKTSALAYAMPLARGTLIVIADSDDGFTSDALLEFHTAWQQLTLEEQKHCHGVIALCVSQHHKPIGEPYMSEGYYDPVEFAFGGEIDRVGENWIASNAVMMKKHFMLTQAELELGFIPESYFWNKIVMSERSFGYRINKHLRIYYINEAEASLSVGIRKKAAKGFYFESRYFLNHYRELLFKYPKSYLKHLLKYILFVQYMGVGFYQGLADLNSVWVKVLYSVLFPVGYCLHKRYFA